MQPCRTSWAVSYTHLDVYKRQRETWEELERVYGSCFTSDIMIVLSDVNAQTGKKSELRPTMGMRSLYDRTSANSEN